MDPLFTALSLFRRRKYEECAEICSTLLEKNPYDQAVWTLKMRSLTEQIYVDDIESAEEGIAEILLGNEALNPSAKPGTSLLRPPTSTGHRPQTHSGRPLSGVVRPGSQAPRPTTVEQALKTPRSARTSRPVTSQSARTIRLGTASMLTEPDGPFINLSRLNLSKYAARAALAKPLFEYIFYHENDVRHAVELAVQANAQPSRPINDKNSSAATSRGIQRPASTDWWWEVALAKCYHAAGLARDTEARLRKALALHKSVDLFLRLNKVYIKLDQPLTALEVCRQGLEYFPREVTLNTEIARLHESLNNMSLSVKIYKEILEEDATNIEAIACIGMHHFYNEQPEVALRFYRRLLQIGVYNGEIFNNLGMCCFHAQQWDLALPCFERALALASDNDVLADIWYNLSHISLNCGDVGLARQCLQVTLSYDLNHGAAYNDLGAIEARSGRRDTARAYFHAAAALSPYLYEPRYNQALLAEKTGDLQTSYIVIQKALEIQPDHISSKELFEKIKPYFLYL